MSSSTTAADIKDSILDTVGETPLVRLSRIGAGVTPQLVAKLEYFNPGGSIKDRVAMRLVEAAERDGRLRPGGTIIEPTSGNTGTGLAIAARLKGYRVIAVMPDKMSKEKIDLLRAYGAEVVVAPTDVSPDSPQSYYRVADRLTEEIPGAFQPNQYRNPANPQTHYETTGPELWRDTGGSIDAFVCATGTGGTLAGVACYLKECNARVRIVLADPQGSALYSWVKTGELKAQGSSITEGIGTTRVTANLEGTPIDDAVAIDDPTCVRMVYRLLREEGFFVGGSSGINVAAAVQVAREMGPGHTIVTLLCDRGGLYAQRLFNPAWLREKGFDVS
jgi:cysteine synthase A